MLDFIDIPKMVETFGYVGLGLIVFAESGVFLGFFLPGDSLLFTAGLLASQGTLSLPVLLPLLFVCAVAGDSFGYAFGRRVGPRLFSKPDARLFKQSHVRRTQDFYDRHGPKTIILARFVPIVRTFAPILAGVGRMEYSKFIRFNVIGGFIWAVGVTTAGYVLGEIVPDVDKYLLPVIAVIVAASLVPAVLEVMRSRRKR
ncbi:MAG TPA: VTT domain-containing protein [Actinomycetota bacterium]|nr:VTT domain-containing protein [Actinomycetota bacterium]